MTSRKKNEVAQHNGRQVMRPWQGESSRTAVKEKMI
jgi:hypothetical protein